MKIEELIKIAEKNNYRYYGASDGTYNFYRKRDHAFLGISIFKINQVLFLDNDWCDEFDFNMIKAVIKFAETSIEERGDYDL